MCCSQKNEAGNEHRHHDRPADEQKPHKPCCGGCAQKQAAHVAPPVIVQTPLPIPEIVYRVLHSPGVPMDTATRRAMESYLRADLGDIRLHIDSQAAESAEAIHALAYAFGNHIVFGPGLYLPGEPTGKRILVHELTHALQQAASWNRPRVWPESLFESAPKTLESEAEAFALALARPQASPRRRPRQISEAPLQLACLGANPGCTQGQREAIHQAIFDANAWCNNAIRKLETRPTPRNVVSALRRNFGNTYGVTANLQLFIDRIRFTKGVMNRMPIGCNSTDPVCVARHCGFANAGSLAATICAVSFEAGVTNIFRSRCVLHESFHAAFSRFTVDHYSSGHGTSAADASYPGAGVDPLLNADSYTTLVMDLS